MSHPDPPDLAELLLRIEHDADAEIGRRFADLIAGYFAATAREDGPVSRGTPAETLHRRYDRPPPDWGAPMEDVLERLVTEVLPEAIRLWHPMYLGHQVSAPLPAAVWTDGVVSAVNNSMAVREMSPAFTAIETRLVRWLASLAGFGEGAGGTLTSGGTEATFTALLAARARALPDSWERGLPPDPPVVLCGEHAHYAVSRAVAELGLGMRRAIRVPSRGHRMDPGALEAELDRLARDGIAVMAVVATAGSTATGSFDDLETIGTLCAERGIWLHVDAAHGGSALLSERHRHRLRGIERAESVAWDPHKLMLLPLSAGMLLVRDERALERAFAQEAPYLFHGGAADRVPDQGIRSFQCSRRADVLKLWVALERYGARGLGLLHDHLSDLARALHDAVRRRPGFVALHQPESNIVCFRWVGDGALDDAALDEVNRELRERYNRSGRGWITATVLDGRRVLRVTVMNPRTTPAHLERLLDGLAETAAGLAAPAGPAAS